MSGDTIPICYLGCRDVHELRAQMDLPRSVLEGAPEAYEILFESGMELSPAEHPDLRVWVIGRAARPGDPTGMSAAEAGRLAGPAASPRPL